MFIDKNGKLFGKISIVDILVIIVILTGVLGTYFTVSTLNSGKLNDNSKLALNSSAPLKEATVTFYLKGVRSMTRDALCEGDDVYETEDNKFIGTISEISSKPSVSEYVANDGYVYSAEIPERYDVTITVKANGKSTETGFHTESGLQILYGKEIEIKTSNVKTKPKIIGIEIKTTGENNE